MSCYHNARQHTATLKKQAQSNYNAQINHPQARHKTMFLEVRSTIHELRILQIKRVNQGTALTGIRADSFAAWASSGTIWIENGIEVAHKIKVPKHKTSPYPKNR